MTDFDPFKDYNPYTEVHQRINQTLSQAGCPAVLDWEEIDPLAESSADATFYGRISELDSNPLARAVASELLESILRPGEFADDVRTDTRWCDESFLRAVVYSVDLDACLWVNLKTVPQWELVAAAYKNPELTCQAHNHPDCGYFNNFTDELTAYAVKRGEIIVIFYSCDVCRERMNNWDWTAQDYFQRGAGPWFDTGPNFEEDPWR